MGSSVVLFFFVLFFFSRSFSSSGIKKSEATERSRPCKFYLGSIPIKQLQSTVLVVETRDRRGKALRSGNEIKKRLDSDKRRRPITLPTECKINGTS